MPRLLLAGTASGLYAVSREGRPQLLGLPGNLINHVAATQGDLVAVAVPKPGPLHNGVLRIADPERQRPGLHTLRLAGEQGEAAQQAQVWAGDARSCAVAPDGTLFVGTEPADVLRSADGGATWAGAGGFADAPSRAKWTFPVEPHQPHVLSIDLLPPPPLSVPAAGAPAAAADIASDGGASLSGDWRVVAGVEVGGVLASPDRGLSWKERNEGLYPDVHSCRVDPHDPSRWLAVTGGGLYASHDTGASWRQLTGGMSQARRYPSGLAINPAVPGEVLMTAGDRPPGMGVHVSRSTDGGESWDDITDAVFGGACAGARGALTPVPGFWEGAAVLGTDTGAVLVAEGADRRGWRVLCTLPASVKCLAVPGQSPSSVMH